MTLNDLVKEFGAALGTVLGFPTAGPELGDTVGRVGAAAGAMEGSIGEEKEAAREKGSRVPRPSAGLPDAGTAILNQLHQPAPVAPGDAIGQTAQGLTGGGGPLGFLNEYGVWVLIALVGLIGVWGLIAPGGGVAIVQRQLRR